MSRGREKKGNVRMREKSIGREGMSDMCYRKGEKERNTDDTGR